MNEEWKTLPDYPGYKIGSFGHISSIERDIPHGNRWNKTGTFRKFPEKKLNPELNKGYHRVSLHCGRKKIRILVHRLVALAFVENPEAKKEVNHKDGNRLNNHADNLEWATRAENMKHAFSVLGNIPGTAKLTAQDVREIRIWHETGDVSIDSLARKWNVCRGTIFQIAARSVWKNVA